jgi:hypothetical protein
MLAVSIVAGALQDLEEQAAATVAELDVSAVTATWRVTGKSPPRWMSPRPGHADVT